jgi:hypothetical protein
MHVGAQTVVLQLQLLLEGVLMYREGCSPRSVGWRYGHPGDFVIRPALCRRLSASLDCRSAKFHAVLKVLRIRDQLELILDLLHTASSMSGVRG